MRHVRESCQYREGGVTVYRLLRNGKISCFYFHVNVSWSDDFYFHTCRLLQCQQQQTSTSQHQDTSSSGRLVLTTPTANLPQESTTTGESPSLTSDVQRALSSTSDLSTHTQTEPHSLKSRSIKHTNVMCLISAGGSDRHYILYTVRSEQHPHFLFPKFR